jgi:tripartite-type tricarboxylate transporter receptor subunit TctC
MIKQFIVPALVGAGLAALATSANAQGGQPFFKDRQITVAIGSSTGGGLDTYGRLFARHFSKHLPGAPQVIASNMPGAGGGVVASHVYTRAPKDGTFVGVVFPSVIFDPLLSESMRTNYDPSKFRYIGNAHSEVLVCLLRRDAGPKTPAELIASSVILGSTAPGSTTYDFPKIANGILGGNMKIVTGYKGSREVTLAMERNEVQGICGLGWSTVKVQFPGILKDDLFARVFAQEDLRGHPQLNGMKVPLMLDLASNEADRRALELLYTQNSFARPVIAPPEMPADRLAEMRRAFDATMKDPQLLAEAQKMNIDVHPVSGDEVEKFVARMFDAPPQTVDRIRKALGR